MGERKNMEAETIRKISERVVIGKLLEGCMAALSFDDGIPMDILDGIERFAYGTTPDVFMPEWWEDVAALVNRIADTYPERAEHFKKTFEEIVSIANAALK